MTDWSTAKSLCFILFSGKLESPAVQKDVVATFSASFFGRCINVAGDSWIDFSVDPFFLVHLWWTRNSTSYIHAKIANHFANLGQALFKSPIVDWRWSISYFTEVDKHKIRPNRLVWFFVCFMFFIGYLLYRIKKMTLQRTNISHLGKRKIIFKSAFVVIW